MNDAASVRVLQRPAHLAHDLERLVDVEFLCTWRIEYLGKRSAFEPFHDEEIQVVVAVEVDETDDVRVREVTTLGRFLLEGAQRMAVTGQLR